MPILKLQRRRCWSGLLALIALGIGVRCRAEVQVYPAPPAADFPRSAAFIRVEVRDIRSGTWREVAVYDHESSFAGHAGIAAFGLSSPAEVRVTYKAELTSAEVLPSRHRVLPQIKGNVATFIVREPQNLVLNVNGEIDHPLCLFANPIDSSPPRPDDPEVDYYPGGQVTKYRETQKKRIYIAGGAIVKGAILLGSGVTLSGYGMLYTDTNTNPLKSWQSDDIHVKGVIVYNYGPGLWKQGNWTYLAYSTTHLTVDNVKFFDVFYGEDGIDPDGASRDITIKNCFFHVADDCISPKSTEWQANGNAPRDITIQGCVFWQDLYGHALAIGGESFSTQTMSNVKMLDNDIVRATVNIKLSPHDSAVSIWTGQGMNVSDMVVDGLTIEHSDRPDIFNFTVLQDKTYKGIGSIHDVTIKNIHINAAWKPSEFTGFDGEHRVENLTFEALSDNSKPIATPEEARLNLNSYTANIVLLTGKGANQVRQIVPVSLPASDPSQLANAQELKLDANAFKTDAAVLTRTADGLELIADANAPISGQAIAPVPVATGVVTFKADVTPSQKFSYPNCGNLLGSKDSEQYIAGYADPNTGHVSIFQGTRYSKLASEDKPANQYFAKDKRALTLTVNFSQKTITFSVGDFEMSVPFAAGLTLKNIGAIGFDSYRTGATFSNLRLSSSAK